jgi:hypothetical protein
LREPARAPFAARALNDQQKLADRTATQVIC